MIYIETGNELKMKKILAAVTAGALCMALMGYGAISVIGIMHQKKTEERFEKPGYPGFFDRKKEE